jgi:hypothetical protein
MNHQLTELPKGHTAALFRKYVAEGDRPGAGPEEQWAGAVKGNGQQQLNGFPAGTRFYEWYSLPLASMPDSDGPKFFNYSFDPPHEMASMAGLHTAREVSRETFEALRSAQQVLASI